jgi:hypothetical protein
MTNYINQNLSEWNSRLRGLMKIKYFACVDVILIVLLHTY